MKRLISLLLSLVMILTTFSVVGVAVDEPLVFGAVCDSQGNELSWALSEEGGTLTISGNGYVDELYGTPQWLSYSFTKLVVEDGVVAIPEEAFLQATALEAVELAPSVAFIGERAFYGCENLKTIDFTNVKTVESMAFYGCMALNEIKLSETTEVIDNYAFGYYCNEELDDEFAKIQNVTIYAKENTVAEQYAKANEISFISLSDYSAFFEYVVFEDSSVSLISYTGCPYSDEIIIPTEIDGCEVQRIGSNLFSDTDVKKVYIPNSVISVNISAFENASELTEIICEDGGEYSTVDGVLYESNGKTLIKVPEAKKEISEYSENLELIREGAFRNSNVKEVILPDTVKEIEKNAFFFSKLEKIVMGPDIEIIPKNCFYGCENLAEVVLPENLKKIYSNAFSNCYALTEINLPYGLEIIEGAAFHCTGLKSVIIPDTIDEYIDQYAFGYYSADDIEFVKDEDFEIQGRSGTAAEDYAIENGFKFTDVSPKKPAIISAFTDNVSVTLFWEKTDDADRYEIYRKTKSTAFKKLAEFDALEDTVYSDTTVESGKTYTYTVVAVKGNLKSAYGKGTSVKFLKLSTPKLEKAEMTEDGIKVEWKTVSDAEGYILYRKTKNTEWTEIADFKGKVKKYEDTTCESGKTYSYTVKAYSGEVESSCDYNGISAMYLSIPELKTASNATKGIKITWKKVKGANGYIIGRKTSSTNWEKIAQVKNVDEYIDKKAKAGTTYTYTVVPVCDDVKGFYNEKGITYKRISKVVTESATNTEYGVKITWEPVSKCYGYRVYRKTENGSWKRIATVKGATKSYYTDKKAKSGTKYIYKVVAYSGDYVSYYTEVSKYYLENPELLSAKSGKKGVTTKWEAVNGASGYYVYRKTGSGSYKKLTTIKGKAKNTYLDKSAKKGKTYTYKIKAYYGKTTSAYSNVKKVKDKY